MAADVAAGVKQTVSYALNHALDPAKFALSLPKRVVVFLFNLWYIFCQEISILIFKPVCLETTLIAGDG